VTERKSEIARKNERETERERVSLPPYLSLSERERVSLRKREGVPQKERG